MPLPVLPRFVVYVLVPVFSPPIELFCAIVKFVPVLMMPLPVFLAIVFASATEPPIRTLSALVTETPSPLLPAGEVIGTDVLYGLAVVSRRRPMILPRISTSVIGAVG